MKKALTIATALLSLAVSPSFAVSTQVKSVITPTPTADATSSANQEVDSFKLFWPIVAGRVMGDQFYFLKSAKESLRETLAFSKFKKADFNLVLSEKRTVEAEKLYVEKKDNQNATATLVTAQLRREKAVDYLKKAESEGRYVVDLKNRFIKSFENQQLLLNSVMLKIDEKERENIKSQIEAINTILVKLR